MFTNVGMRISFVAIILAAARLSAGVLMGVPRQSLQMASALPGAETRGFRSSTSLLVRRAGFSRIAAFNPQVRRWSIKGSRGLVMKSGRKASRRSAGSELFRSIAVFGDQNESSRRGRERAAKDQEEKEARLSATVADAAVATTGATTSVGPAVVLTDPNIRNADVIVRSKLHTEAWRPRISSSPPVSEDAERVVAEGETSPTALKKESARTQESVSCTADTLTLPWDVEQDHDDDKDEDDGVKESESIINGRSHHESNKTSRRRGSIVADRRRRKGRVAPLDRAEAVEMVHRAVARFRAAQISDPDGGGSAAAADGQRAVSGTKGAVAVPAEEFAEIARRCLGSGLPEIALEAYSLYMRAAEAGITPGMPLPLAPPIMIGGDSNNKGILATEGADQRLDAERVLLTTAARAHIVMGDVLAGLALIDDAAGLGGHRAQAHGKWGGDGEAGVGATLLDDFDASVLVEELCISGGATGLRAALRLRERLMEEGRRLTREARLALLEALATATGRDLGTTTEDTVRSLTFSGASIPTENMRWFETLRVNARRAWRGSEDKGSGDGVETAESAAGVVDEGRRLGGGGGWVPVGARTPDGGVEIDGEGALVPAFNAQTAARMAQEIVSEMAAGRDAGNVSSRAQAALVRAAFRSSLVHPRRRSDPVSSSGSLERGTVSAGFDEGNLRLALRKGKDAADKFKVTKTTPSAPTKGAKLREGSSAECAVVATESKANVTVENKMNVTVGDVSSASARRSEKKGKGVGGEDRDDRGGGRKVPGGVVLEGAGSGAYDARFRTVSALLQECLAFNYTAGADTVFSQMLTEELWPKTSTFNSLLWYFREQRDPEGALTIMQCLRDSKTVVPNKQTFALAAQACASSGTHLDDAWAFLEEAEMAGVLSSSKELLDTRLVLLQAAGDDVLEGLKDMATLGIMPDEATVIGLMDACADRGDTDGALEVLDAMRDGEKGMKDILPRPSYRPFLAALRACSREALACLPASEATEVVDGDAEVPDTSPDGAVGGDWRACKRVLEMMWADETARMAEQQAAVPGSWSPSFQETLRRGPSHTMSLPVAPDELCYQLAIECCVSHGRLDEALGLVSQMESKGLSPNEAALRALIKGFAADGSGVTGGVAGNESPGAREAAEQRWRGIECALGVFEELAERFNPPSRASFESAVDACMGHPNGLQGAGKLISRMKESGYNLGVDHYDVLIRGFGDARNLGAALEVYKEISGGGGGRGSGGLGIEVEEDTFAALLGACTRSGEFENVSQAIRFLRAKGVSPPRMILEYLQDEVENEIKPETWEKILGEEWTRENIRKEKEKPSPRKFGGSLTRVGSLTGTSMGRDPDEDADLLGVTLETRDVGKKGAKFRKGSGGGDGGQQGTLTFAECARHRLLLLERKRMKGRPGKHGGKGVAPDATEEPQPLCWTGVYNEVHTHAERKEEAMKRKAGEARSRQRRQRKQQEEQAAKRGESQVDEKGQGADRSKAGLSRRARSKQERDEKALSHRPARPLLVRVGGHSASALSDEPSPAVDAVVGGLRRRTGVRGRQRVGGALLGNRKKGDAERSGRGGVGSEG